MGLKSKKEEIKELKLKNNICFEVEYFDLK